MTQLEEQDLRMEASLNREAEMLAERADTISQ